MNNIKVLNSVRSILFVLVLGNVMITGLSAQNQQLIDSLNQRYENEEFDSTKVRILLNIVQAYDLHQIDTAIYLAKKTEELAFNIGDSSHLAEIKGILARYYSIQSQYSIALRYDLEALQLYKDIGDKRGAAATLNGIGEDYYDQDLFKDAYVYYQKSLEKSELLGDKLPVAICTYNIGRVLKSMGQLEQSMSYLENSLDLSEQINDVAGLAYSHHDLGDIHLLKKDYDSALKSLEQSLIFCDSISLEELKPQVLNKMAYVFRAQNKLEQSLKYHEHALEIYRKQSNKRGIGETYFGMGETYLTKKEFDTARQLFSKSLSISKDIYDSELSIENYKNLAQLYEIEGDTELALAFFKKYKFSEDSLFSQRKNEQFAQIQTQYEVAKKDSEIELLNQNEERRSSQLKNEELIRNIFVVILALTGILIANLYRNSIRRKKINARLIEKQKELSQQGRELKSLLSMKDKFFSIISHDLRSPINGLAGIIDFMQEGHITQDELKEVTKSLKIRLDSTKKMLDSLLDWAMVQMNDINPEYATVNVVSLVDENFTFFSEVNEKEIQFVHKITPDVNVNADQNMLDLVIRNLISNAIKFTEQNGQITILASDDQDDVTIEVHDNGIGMNQDQLDNLFDTKSLYTTKGTANEKGTGLGLKLCKEFVEKMGGKIWVESKEGEGSIFKFTVGKAK